MVALARSRLQTFLLFLLGGPLIGFATFILPPTVLALARGEISELVSASYVRTVAFYLAGAYVVGAIPAGLTGLIFALIRTTWRLPAWARLSLAGAIGGAVAGLLSVVFTGASELIALAGAIGAISGAACGLLSRHQAA